MLDQKEKATTGTTPHQVRGRLWQDNHSGLRRHKLMTKELGDTIPAICMPTTNVGRLRRRPRPGQAVQPLQRLALVHHRVGPRDRNCASASSRGSKWNLGYFDLTELAEVTVFGGVPAVERDLYWEPHDPGRDQEAGVGDSSLANDGNRCNQRRNKEKERPCLTTTGMETTRSDAPGADDSLFGDAADDTEAAVAGEQDANEETGTGPAGFR